MERERMTRNECDGQRVRLSGARQVAVGVIGLFSMLCVASVADAVVSGACSNCHTMHNSQGGADFTGNDSTADGALAIGDCVGCHSVTTSAVTDAGGTIPIVWSQTDPGMTNVLAGGNFYWVVSDDTKGHNVVGITSGADGTLSVTPPGWVSSADFAPVLNGVAQAEVGDGTGSWSDRLTCAGTWGCHGKHDAGTNDFAAITGSHHADDSTIDGSTVPNSYRFLAGILGYEGSGWSAEFNRYKGMTRTDDTTGAATSDYRKTIAFLCAECHGKFHSGADNAGTDDGTFGAAWVRHPVDFDLFDASTSEYASYAGNTSAAIRKETPVASISPAGGSSVDPTSDGQAIVTCISCHYAHGSQYTDLLRFSYTMQAGSGTGGCFNCHTTKGA